MAFVDHQGQRHEMADGDTLYFDLASGPGILNGAYSPLPIFDINDTGVVYSELRKYGEDGYVQKHYRDGNTSVSFGNNPPRWWEGTYYALALRTKYDGRFMRFYLKTNEDLAIYTDTTHYADTTFTTIEKVVTRYDTIRINQTVYEVLPANLSKLESGIDSLIALYSNTGGPIEPGKTKQEIIEAELVAYSLEDLARKYYKSRPIEVDGQQISTCDFAEYAGLSCSRVTEAVIFNTAYDLLINK